jgi:hypothetical protein
MRRGAPSVRHGRFLSLIVIRVLLMAVPAVFLISMTPLSLLFVVVADDALVLTRSLSFTVPAGSGRDVGDAAANRRRLGAFSEASSPSRTTLRGRKTRIRLVQ